MGGTNETTRQELVAEVVRLRQQVERLEENAQRRAHTEEELRQAQKMDAIGRLTGGLAHDFNNVLTVISGYCEILLHRMTGDEPHWKPVHEIAQATDRAAALTSQLLAFARRQPQQPTVLDLNTVVDATVEMLSPLLGEPIRIQVTRSS